MKKARAIRQDCFSLLDNTQLFDVNLIEAADRDGESSLSILLSAHRLRCSQRVASFECVQRCS